MLPAATFGWHASAGAVQSATPFPIQTTDATLPQGNVTVRALLQGPGPRTPFYAAFFDAYAAAHPNISLEIDELAEKEIQEILPISIQNGNAHDLFMLGGALSIAEAVRAGWISPLDEVIPNFAEWQAHFPEGVFVDGITMFGGKTYTFPMSTNRRYGTLIFYSNDYFAQAGIDPTTAMRSWDGFRETARTLTEQGSGQYYGLVVGLDPTKLQELVTNFSVSAGASAGPVLGGPMNWQTGEYTFTAEETLGAIDLLLGLQEDGSILPGSASLSQREAEARVTSGNAAMTLDGPWLISRWKESFPEFNYGIASQPMRDPESFSPIGYAPGGANQHFVYAESQQKAVLGDILWQWGSPDGQAAFQTIVGGTLEAIQPEAVTRATIDAPSQQAIDLFKAQMRLHPDPRVRNPDVAQVFLEAQRLQPTFGEVLQGIMVGQIGDPQSAMQDLQDRASAELERAIKAAQDAGAQVTRDDFVFPNWDPSRDYTDADYAAL
jgi:multiple sugar transport system substrate-binding protein